MGDLKSDVDVQDLIRGLTLLGTGGGGPWVLSPDLIMLMDADSGTPYTNTLLPEGSRVGVVGAVADPKLRTPAALALLGPAHYGHDIPYTPMEQLVRS